MRQTHINTQINTIAIEHGESIKAIKAQKCNTAKYQYDSLFNIFIGKSEGVYPKGGVLHVENIYKSSSGTKLLAININPKWRWTPADHT